MAMNPIYAGAGMAGPSAAYGSFAQPQPWYSQFGSALGRNSNMLLGLGSGLLSGNLANIPQGIAAGSQADSAYAASKKADQDRQSQINQTAAWAEKNGFPQYAPLIKSGAISGSDVFNLVTRQQSASGDSAPATVQEWNAFSKLSPTDQAAYLRMKRANPYLDVGTGYVQPDPVNPGQTTGPAITKDNYTPAYDKGAGGAAGAADAANDAEAATIASKLPGIQSVVDQLGVLADKATYTQTGQLWDNIIRETGQTPSEAAQARTQYLALVDNQVLPLLRDTFGAAFTEKEGQTLRDTLGAPDKSPLEKKAILSAFIEQKKRDLQAMRSRAPVGSTPPASIGSGGFSIISVSP